jgi:hypothetical protein
MPLDGQEAISREKLRAKQVKKIFLWTTEKIRDESVRTCLVFPPGCGIPRDQHFIDLLYNTGNEIVFRESKRLIVRPALGHPILLLYLDVSVYVVYHFHEYTSTQA